MPAALQSIRSSRSPEGVSASRRPLGVGCSFRGLFRCRIAGYWFCDPVLPLAVSSTSRSSSSGGCSQVNDRHRLSSSFALLQSVLRHDLVRRRSRRTPLMGFCSLQHTTDSEVHYSRALPARCVPPSGFGYPLGGLLPPSPCRLCFTPAALLGFTLRSFLLAKGIHHVSAAEGPTYRLTRRLSRRRSGGPAQRAPVSGL
jgi:hypothetical protein